MVDETPAWLERIPVDHTYVVLAALAVILGVVFRSFLVRISAGRKALHAFHVAEGALLALLLLGMIVLSFLQIVLRNLVHGGLLWIDPLLRHLVLWVGFLGALLASRHGRHINVDALSRFLKPSLLRLSRILTNLLAAFVCLLLSNACLKMVRDEALAGTTDFLGLPIWLLQSIMPLAPLVMSYRFFGHMLRALRATEKESVSHLAGAPS